MSATKYAQDHEWVALAKLTYGFTPTDQPRPTPVVAPPKAITPVRKKTVPVRKKKPRKKSVKILTRP